jgi:hypothetical protein
MLYGLEVFKTTSVGTATVSGSTTYAGAIMHPDAIGLVTKGGPLTVEVERDASARQVEVVGTAMWGEVEYRGGATTSGRGGAGVFFYSEHHQLARGRAGVFAFPRPSFARIPARACASQACPIQSGVGVHRRRFSGAPLLDIKAIYQRPHKDPVTHEVMRDHAGFPEWDTVGGLPMQHHTSTRRAGSGM